MIKLKNLLTEEEKSWAIKEKRPIKVKIEPVRGKVDYIRITVPPMKMKYDTFEDLNDSGGGDTSGKYSDVSVSTYDYKNGEAKFLADDMESVEKWLKKFKKIVTK
jgi:hypothetical protein